MIVTTFSEQQHYKNQGNIWGVFCRFGNLYIVTTDTAGEENLFTVSSVYLKYIKQT